MRAVSLAILSTALIMSGCGKKDKPASQASGDLPSFVNVQAPDVSAADAEAALKAMNLWDSTGSNLSWDTKDATDKGYIYKNVVIRDEDGADGVNIGTLEITGARMEGGSPMFSTLIARDTKSLAGSDDEVSIGRVALVGPSPEMAAAVAQMLGSLSDGTDSEAFDNMGFDFDALEIDDVSIKSDEDGDLTTVSMDALRFGGEGDKKTAFVIRDVSVVSADANIKLGAFDMRGPYAQIVSDSMNEDYDGMAFSKDELMNMMENGSMMISGLDMQAEGLTLKMPSFTSSGSRKGDKLNITSEMKSLFIDVDPNSEMGGEITQQLNMLGYDNLEFSFVSKSTYDTKTDVMSIGEYKLGMKDGFTLNIDGTFPNYSDVLEAQAEAMAMSGDDPMMMMQMYQGGMMESMTIGDMTISFKDDSIVERGLKMYADMQGMDLATARKQAKGMTGMVSMMAMQDPSMGEFGTDAAEALSAFLDGGKTLTISMDPAQPLTPMDLQGLSYGATEFGSLGLSIKTK